MKTRRCALLLCGLFALLCHRSTLAERPRLVVVVVFDQLPEWALELYEPILPEDGGIKRLIREGVWYQDAWYPQAATVTAVGHSVISTGLTPRHSGIVGNGWYDPTTGRAVYCVADERHRTVGSPGGGASPHRLRVPTVGDLLRLATAGRGKVVSVAGKDRSAVLMAGHGGQAYWYSRTNGMFVTSTYYQPEGKLPDWVVAFNKEGRIRRYAGALWALTLEPDAYVQSVDDRPCEPEGGRTFPHRMPEAASPVLGGAVYSSPFLHEHILAFAKAAIEGEGLGQDEVPDLLWIGLSATDAVGHRYGPFSLEYQDCLIRTDRALGAFFAQLDRAVGTENWAAVVSADHGVAPCPEHLAAHGIDAKRVDFTELRARVVEALAELAGDPESARALLAAWGPYVYLNRKKVQELGLDLGEVQRRIAKALELDADVAAAFAAEDLLNGDYSKTDFLAAQAAQTIHPAIGPDVVVVLRPYCIPGNGRPATGTTHGSPHSYDARVPILVRFPRLSPADGPETGDDRRTTEGGALSSPRVYVTQIAATISRWLRLPRSTYFPPLPFSTTARRGGD